MEQATTPDECLRRLLDVQDPGAGRHPLRIAVGDDASAAVRIAVLERAVDHVRDGLEPTVRMPGRALGFARGIVDLAHLVEMDEGIQVRQFDPGERPPNRETLALEPARRRGDALDRPLRGDGRIRRGDPWQDGDVFDDDGGHGSKLLVGDGSRTIAPCRCVCNYQ